MTDETKPTESILQDTPKKDRAKKVYTIVVDPKKFVRVLIAKTPVWGKNAPADKLQKHIKNYFSILGTKNIEFVVLSVGNIASPAPSWRSVFYALQSLQIRTVLVTPKTDKTESFEWAQRSFKTTHTLLLGEDTDIKQLKDENGKEIATDSLLEFAAKISRRRSLSCIAINEKGNVKQVV